MFQGLLADVVDDLNKRSTVKSSFTVFLISGSSAESMAELSEISHVHNKQQFNK